MAKGQFSPEELEHIEGKEIHKEIHYNYICNRKSNSEEIILFIEKLAVLFLFFLLVSIFAPNIFTLITDLWQAMAQGSSNITAY